MRHEPRRRHVLAAAGALALGTGAAACGSRPVPEIPDVADVTLPTYRPLEGLTPDLPGSSEGLHDVYLTVPDQLLTTTTAEPITSGTITGLTQTFQTPPPPMDRNPFWQRLNSALGGVFDLDVVVDDYPSKFATTLASGNLPDLMWVPPNQGIPNVGPMLEAAFTDLTDYLAGDAVLEYPNLAALREDSWRTAVVNGRIWGAPIPSTPFGQVYVGNPAVWQEVDGFRAESATQFLEKCRELSIPGRRWALEPFLPNAFHMIGEWFGVPNGYRVEEDRSLTAAQQTDEYLEALEFARELFASGAFYPDFNLAEAPQLLANGTLSALVSVGPSGAAETRQDDPELRGDILIPFPAVEGRIPTYDMGYGTVGFTPFRKTDDEARIRELLSVIDYLSAPFGTTEFMQVNWGTEGKEYTVEDGNYVLTKEGSQNVPGLQSALEIMAAGEGVIYNPIPDDSRYIYEREQELLPLAQKSPTKGLYSPTDSRVGTTIKTRLDEARDEVIQGRATMDHFTAALREWEEEGGKQIIEEYSELLPEEVPVTPSNRV
ncbi:sugar ABC transporter substrate-binding protein [Brachybacterium sacelli]|uniref:Aldouronate transport system substrate-binding protein n=1 Tax=Brachybacterium sacelli TaxID=173364 RepID=A0ABS4WZ39_9MICO|nr:sugar ABC transporter substrate-binding protein [Brachybacterium sacelli]MBP2381233.1 putative aldouronate transport system substrate-binding protein [Brachybacterium sacelli]